MNVVENWIAAGIRAPPRLLPRYEDAWSLDPLVGALRLDELAAAAGESNRATGKGAPAGPTPLTPTLHAAAAEAPAARLASSAARTGDRCRAGADLPTRVSGDGLGSCRFHRFVDTVGTACAATPSNADSSRLESSGVTAVRIELSIRRSASTATRQRGQNATCWSQTRSVAAGRLRSAYALSISSTCREEASERAPRTKLTGSPEQPAPTRSPDGPASARPFWMDRERDAPGTLATVSGRGGCANGPCPA